MDSETMTPREKAAVLWAEHVTLNTAKTRDDVFCEVRHQFDDTEFVELTMVITYFNMRNRFQDALRIPLDERENESQASPSDAGRTPRISRTISQRWWRRGPRVSRDRRMKTALENETNE